MKHALIGIALGLAAMAALIWGAEWWFGPVSSNWLMMG
jgi:hypothetical protein